MPRKPVPCSVCGAPRPWNPATQDPAAIVCRACRDQRAVCGTLSRYRRGCRCEECRAAHTAYVRAAQERFRDRHGRLPSSDWRARNGIGRVYWIDTETRKAIYARDEYGCGICGEPTDPTADPNDDLYPSLDHIVPRSLGGTDDPENLRTAHRVCNARRGARRS